MIIGLCRIYRGRAFRLRCRVHAGSTFPKPPVLRKVQKMARNVARCAAVRRIVLNFDVSRIWHRPYDGQCVAPSSGRTGSTAHPTRSRWRTNSEYAECVLYFLELTGFTVSASAWLFRFYCITYCYFFIVSVLKTNKHDDDDNDDCYGWSTARMYCMNLAGVFGRVREIWRRAS